MTRKERIAKIQKRIAEIDRKINRFPDRITVSAALAKLYDRRDRWEERLVQAEVGPLKVYSRA